MAEDEQALPDEQKVIRDQAISWLAQLFSEEDWQAIAMTAAQSVANDIRQMGRQAAVQTVLH